MQPSSSTAQLQYDRGGVACAVQCVGHLLIRLALGRQEQPKSFGVSYMRIFDVVTSHST